MINMMYRREMKIDNFDIKDFLENYWQKKPLLIRGGFSGFNNPLSPDELAGLSCETEIESRLIISSDDYKMRHGPFDDDDFAALENAIYTLLVQGVDHHIPDVMAMLNPFRFIPNWRIDDVMVSYANKGGGVGAHFDQYDVFLVQGLGQRRWQIGQICDGDTLLLPHDDLRLIADFKMVDEWVLDPGDILYVPPMVAHNGMAQSDDCMTYSIGFRAPSQSELIAGYCDYWLDEMSEHEDIRYKDLDYFGQSHSGEISSNALDALYDLMMDKLANRDEFTRWFGRYNSESKYPHLDDASMNDSENIDGPVTLMRSPASRFSYIVQQDQIILFAGGEEYYASMENLSYIQSLSSQDEWTFKKDTPSEIKHIIAKLMQRDLLSTKGH